MKLAKFWWKSWSFWLMLASAGLGAAELALPLFNGVFPPKLFATASMIVGIAAAVARTVYQASMHDASDKP